MSTFSPTKRFFHFHLIGHLHEHEPLTPFSSLSHVSTIGPSQACTPCQFSLCVTAPSALPLSIANRKSISLRTDSSLKFTVTNSCSPLEHKVPLQYNHLVLAFSDSAGRSENQHPCPYSQVPFSDSHTVLHSSWLENPPLIPNLRELPSAILHEHTVLPPILLSSLGRADSPSSTAQFLPMLANVDLVGIT